MKRRFMICIAALLITLFCAVSLAACGDEEQNTDNDQPNEVETLSFDENSSLSEIKAALAGANTYRHEFKFIGNSIDGGTAGALLSGIYSDGIMKYVLNGYEDAVDFTEDMYLFRADGQYYSYSSYIKGNYPYTKSNYLIIDPHPLYKILFPDINLYLLKETEGEIGIDDKAVFDIFLRPISPSGSINSTYVDSIIDSINTTYVEVGNNSIEYGFHYTDKHNCWDVAYKIYGLNEPTEPIDISHIIGGIDEAEWAVEVLYNGYAYYRSSIDGEECYMVVGKTKDYVEGTMPETTINTLPVRERN